MSSDDDTPTITNKQSEGENITFLTIFRPFYSLTLLIFSITIITTLIFTRQTQLSKSSHPLVAIALIWFLLIWLAMMEGGQASLVGLSSINRKLYAESHPKALKSTSLVHNGGNMERFIVGRQFQVVLVVFLINLSGAALPGSEVLALPNVLNSIFVESGLAMILFTVVVGQLTAQVNATNCMLDVINNYFTVYLVTYASLWIEFSGLLHFVYLVHFIFSKVSGKPLTPNESPRSILQAIFFWSRVTFSCIVLGFAFAVVLYGIFHNQTTVWVGFPPILSATVCFLLIILSGLMEGMQIAILAALKLPSEELAQHPVVLKNCELTFQSTNLQAFLIGRQILVTACMFLVARIITLDMIPGRDETIFGISDVDFHEKFLNSNILGAIITTVTASLIWRVIASSSPILFLSNPMIYGIIRLCLIMEASGLCSAAWTLARIHKTVTGLRPDEEYIGILDDMQATVTDLELQETSDSIVSSDEISKVVKQKGEEVDDC
jgi:hypothetical protein